MGRVLVFEAYSLNLQSIVECRESNSKFVSCFREVISFRFLDVLMRLLLREVWVAGRVSGPFGLTVSDYPGK